MIKRLFFFVSLGIILFYGIHYFGYYVVVSEEGMTFLLTMFMVINPIYFMVSGLYLGKYFLRLLLFPYLMALLFQMSVRSLYFTGTGSQYAIHYAMIGYTFMILAFLRNKMKIHRKLRKMKSKIQLAESKNTLIEKQNKYRRY
ncbi:MAG: hypothetical protein R3Y53_07405 [Bacillota bacterium]